MHRALLAALLSSSALYAQAPATMRCDPTWRERGVPAQRTVVLTISADRRSGRVPRPFADEVLEHTADAFRLPGKITVPLYTTPERFPGDTAPHAKATWTHADLHVLARVTLDSTGLPRKTDLFEPSYDENLDSAFVRAVRYALADTGWVNHRSSPTPPRGDSIVVDVGIDVTPVRTKKEQSEYDKRLKNNNVLEVPIGRLTMLHYDYADTAALVKRGELKYPDEQRRHAKDGYALVHAVLDTNGKMVEAWFPEATHKNFEIAALNFLLVTRYRPVTVAGCPVAARVSEPFNFKMRWF